MMINKRLIGLCEETKKYILLTVMMNWVALMCNVMIILKIGELVNGLLVGNQLKASELCLLIGLLGIRFVANLLYGKYSALASEEAKLRLRESVYEKLLTLGMCYGETERTASMVQVMVEGVEQLEIYFGRYLPQFFYALLAPLTLFIVVSTISFKAAMVLLLAVPLIPISIAMIMKIAKRILKNYWKSYANLGGTFLENLQGLTTLKVFDQDEVYHKKMNEEAESFRVMTMKVLSMQLNSINIMDFVAFGGAAAGIIIALLEFKRGELLVGQLLIIILLSAEFFIPMRLLGSYFHIAMNGMTASERIFKVLDAKGKEEILESVSDLEGEIRLEGVDFAYEENRPILKEVHMQVASRGLTAIVGASGSGKSTVAALMMKMYEPQQGKITWGHTDFSKVSEKTLYEKVTLISTNSYIFNGTLRENLLMGNPYATKEQIQEVLKQTKLETFIESLKEGLETPVGESGNLLSGGQKQRLALARAILADRQVMIFDEATSNIDVESEEAIWDVIHELAKVKRVVVISHRLANIKQAQKIYVMKEGNVVEEGTHEELLGLQKVYHQMICKQDELEKVREV